MTGYRLANPIRVNGAVSLLWYRPAMRFVLIFLTVAAVDLTGFRSDAAPEVPLRFAFGPGPYPDGVTAVRDTGGYDAARGFGFEPGADCQFAGGAVVGLKPFAFSIRLPEGNSLWNSACSPATIRLR